MTHPRLSLLLLAAAFGALTGCSPTASQFDCGDGGCSLACSMSGTSCSATAPCCPELACRNGSCGPACFNLGTSCSATEPCCSDLQCRDGKCGPACLLLGYTGCSATAPCCSGLTCHPDGVCVPPCSGAGGTCTGLGTCCSGFACNTSGVCVCGAEGESCGASAPCCAGTSCDGTGHCRAPCPLPVGACQPFGGACAVDGGDCCAPSSCNGGRCTDPSTAISCSGESAPCATGSDCCGTVAFGSRLDCVAVADGGGICHFGQPGEVCNSTRQCTPGVVCVVPPDSHDAGPLDSGMVGASDGGASDGGASDGGASDGGASDGGGPAETSGVCTLLRTNISCTLYTPGCGLGDTCNPSNSTNQGYDPCFYKVVGSSLGYRAQVAICRGGVCAPPAEGDSCKVGCAQTAGDPRKTTCLASYDGTGLCMPACASDADCRTSSFYDSRLSNAQRVTNFCVNYAGGAGCQPALCFMEGEAGMDNPAVLYKPCADHANTLCLPRYSGSDSNILGFCTAVTPSPAPTVGKACDPRAGREALNSLCGADAVCLGGRCAALCDAATLGRGGTPKCTKDKTCISPQGLDLISDYQFGGCGDPCDPFTDLEHSGCVNYCGGPSARCNWIVGDPQIGEPKGYCGSANTISTRIGQACVMGAIDPCEAGAYCLSSSSGGRTCTRLCDPTVGAGTPSACPTGKTCTAFQGFKKSGYCR